MPNPLLYVVFIWLQKTGRWSHCLSYQQRDARSRKPFKISQSINAAAGAASVRGGAKGSAKRNKILRAACINCQHLNDPPNPWHIRRAFSRTG